MPYCAETGCSRHLIARFYGYVEHAQVSLGGVAYQCKKCSTPGAGPCDNFFI
jgi:hypothetical protein